MSTRQPYTEEEDNFIIDYIISHNSVKSIASRSLWTHIAAAYQKRFPGTRTCHSLKSRLRDQILKKMHKFLNVSVKKGAVMINILAKDKSLLKTYKDKMKKLKKKLRVEVNDAEVDGNSSVSEVISQGVQPTVADKENMIESGSTVSSRPTEEDTVLKVNPEKNTTNAVPLDDNNCESLAKDKSLLKPHADKMDMLKKKSQDEVIEVEVVRNESASEEISREVQPSIADIENMIESGSTVSSMPIEEANPQGNTNEATYLDGNNGETTHQWFIEHWLLEQCVSVEDGEIIDRTIEAPKNVSISLQEKDLLCGKMPSDSGVQSEICNQDKAMSASAIIIEDDPHEVIELSSDEDTTWFDNSDIDMGSKWRYYKLDEEKRLLNYILQNNLLPRIMGVSIYKEMVDQDVIQGRTWQSLKSHFLLMLKQKKYKRYLSPEDLQKLEKALARNNKERKKKMAELNEAHNKCLPSTSRAGVKRARDSWSSSSSVQSSARASPVPVVPEHSSTVDAACQTNQQILEDVISSLIKVLPCGCRVDRCQEHMQNCASTSGV